MNDLIRAVNEYLAASDVYERAHTDQTRRFRDRKRSVLDHELRRHQKQEAEYAERAALWRAENEPEEEGRG